MPRRWRRAPTGTISSARTRWRRASRVATRVAELPAEKRREEIARMLAGAEITNEARAAAERLIKAASCTAESCMPSRSQNRQNARRIAHRQAGEGRARAADGRNLRARQALLPAGPADDLRRRIRRVARALQRDRGALSRSAHAGIAVAEGRRRAHRPLQEGPPRGADAVARQRDGRAGRHRFRRPHPALSEAG